MTRVLFLLSVLPLIAQEPFPVEAGEVEGAATGVNLLTAAGRKFDQGLNKLEVQYMKDLAKVVMHADRAEIFLLDFKAEHGPKE